jgi:hypothetical protein
MNNLSKKCFSLLIFVLAFGLMSCASTPLKAPCDAQATFCGIKTKINSW